MKEPLITLFTIAQYSNISLFQFVFLQSIHYCIRYFFCLLSYSTQYIMCLKAETFLLLNSLLFHNFYNIWNMLGKYLMNYISKGNFQNINDVEVMTCDFRRQHYFQRHGGWGQVRRGNWVLDMLMCMEIFQEEHKSTPKHGVDVKISEQVVGRELSGQTRTGEKYFVLSVTV